MTNIVAIAAGAKHSLALETDGTVVAWGANGFGQRDVPDGLSNIVAIAANASLSGSYNLSMNYSLALTSGGSVVSWGRGPRLPGGLTNVVALSAGADFGMALIGSGPLVLRTDASDPRWAGGIFTCRIQTQSGRVYSLQYKDSLGELNWTSLNMVAGTGHIVTLKDTSATGLQRMYRILRW